MSTSLAICASFRFYDDVLAIQKQLEEAGIRCEVPVPNEYYDFKTPSRVANALMENVPKVFEAFWRNMEMHQARIVDTGLVYIYAGPEGYVGNGVSSEMGFSHALREHVPGEKGRTILSSHTIADIAMRGFVQEVVSPESLIRRLS